MAWVSAPSILYIWIAGQSDLQTTQWALRERQKYDYTAQWALRERQQYDYNIYIELGDMGSKPTSTIPTKLKALGSKKDCLEVCVINNAWKNVFFVKIVLYYCVYDHKEQYIYQADFSINTKVHYKIFLLMIAIIMCCLSLKLKLSYSCHCLRLKSASKLHSGNLSMQTASKMLQRHFLISQP